MTRFAANFRVLLMLLVASAALSVTGCTKKPSQNDLAKLEEARAAAENAERKLADLRKERMDLEKALEEKQAELKRQEQERDELKQRLGKQ